jgi:integral membrane protein (TIGR01906 family)
LIGIATALVIIGGSIAPFLTPSYLRFEQDRTGVGTLTGYAPGELDQIAGQILGDLVLWRGDFHPQAGAGPMAGEVLTDPERSHMLDVRNVFTAFWAIVLVGVLTVAVAFRRARGTSDRAATWRAVRSGASWLAVAIAVAGAFAVVAFDAAFEVFHRLFFGAGTSTFDPATSKLVQLFPEAFWSETAIIVGMMILVVAILTAWLAGRQAARIGEVA